MPKRLVRVRDSYLAGVCAGLGRYFDIHPFWCRIAWVAAILVYGTGVLLYLALWWIMPREDRLPVEPTVWVRTPSGAHPPLQRTLYDRKFLGVCGGLARRFAIDPVWVRLATLFLFTISAGLVFVAYLIVAALMPTQHAQLGTPHGAVGT